MKNTQHVPIKQWRKWSDTARRVFNSLYVQIRDNHEILFPKSAHKLTKTAVKIIAWNSAWVAADAVDGRCSDE